MKRPLFQNILFLSFCVIVGCQSYNDGLVDTDTLTDNDGLTDHTQGDQQSIGVYEQAILVNPDLPEVHYNLGLAYSERGRYEQAIEAHEKAIQIKPDFAAAYCGLGMACHKLGRYQEAIEAYRQAVGINPDIAEAHCNMGIAYCELENYGAAVVACKQAIRINPTLAKAHSNLGLAYSKLGHSRKAFEAYERAVAIDPNLVETRHNLGIVAEVHYRRGETYAELGRYQHAIKAYKQAIRLKPDYGEAHCGLGASYSELSRYNEAIEAYKVAIDIKPDLPMAHWGLGRAYLMVGEKGDAVDKYEVLKTLDKVLAERLFELIYEDRQPRVEQSYEKWPSHIQNVLKAAKPLEYHRGNRLPLYLWQAMDPGLLDDEAAEELVKELDRRGVGLITSWDPDDREKSLAGSLAIAKAQKKLHLRVNINATACLHSFFNGDPQTAHVDDQGEPFWDSSFGEHKMGCPFAIDFRRSDIREQLDYFAEAFKKAGLDVDFIFADRELDGPIEFNEANTASRKCKLCRQSIDNIDDFERFQRVLRELRCELHREVYTDPIIKRFPKALIGDYGVYPHNGYRYWYDYYEYYVDGQPCRVDQRARYRKWYHEFPGTGYTSAMPVVYPWRRIYDWYDYVDSDYRWFYNMLLVASNVGKCTPSEIPIISFVHWHTIDSGSSAGEVKQFSEEKYQELLWHMLLRGTDTFLLWCQQPQATKEIELVHQVYTEAQRYGRFLSKGKPITFNVRKQAGTVISGLKLEYHVLVRRTDFKESGRPVRIGIGNKRLEIPPTPGRCRIISLR